MVMDMGKCGKVSYLSISFCYGSGYILLEFVNLQEVPV